MISGPGWLSRLLDGAHPWGSYEAAVSRYGVRRYSLIIYPPGTSTADRRLARLWRAWPITAAALMLLCVMVFGNTMNSPDTVLTVAAVAYLSVSLLLFFRAGPVRVRARSMSIILMPDSADLQELYRYTQWRTLVEMLINADRMLMTRAISPVEHEAIWWEAYDSAAAIADI
ncbi:hypothetical protein A5730_09585 [Mycobacterium sp. ACS4054]|nr:hypothetical protein A5730_09585 [Mycobacterium sp. ACS4054]